MDWNFSIRLAIRMTYVYGRPSKGEIERAPIGDVIVKSLPCPRRQDNDAKGGISSSMELILFQDGLGM